MEVVRQTVTRPIWHGTSPFYIFTALRLMRPSEVFIKPPSNKPGRYRGQPFRIVHIYATGTCSPPTTVLSPSHATHDYSPTIQFRPPKRILSYAALDTESSGANARLVTATGVHGK